MPHATQATTNLQEMLKPLGEHPFLTNVSSLLTTIGFWAALIGVTGVYRSITASGAAWARLGFYFTLIGTALWTISFSLDVSTASAVANWLSAPMDGKDAAWGAVAAVSAVGRGVLPMTWIVYWTGFCLPGYWHHRQRGISPLVGLGRTNREHSYDRFGHRPDFHRALDHAHPHFRASDDVNHIMGPGDWHLDRPKSMAAARDEQPDLQEQAVGINRESTNCTLACFQASVDKWTMMLPVENERPISMIGLGVLTNLSIQRSE